MAKQAQKHEEFWINPKFLITSITELVGVLCEIRNATILAALEGGEAKDALRQMAVKLKLL